MRHFTPEIVYHEILPIYSVDIQPKSQDIFRLATAGFDCVVRIWKLEKNVKCVKKSNPVDLLANLKRHERRVNVVRWSPNGKLLASASDDKTINIWSKSENQLPIREKNNVGDDEDDFVNIENWMNVRCLRRHLEDVYDLSWSSNSHQFISGSVDCTAILWDLKAPIKPMMLKDHKQFVQGVAWDPSDNFVITQSNDRTFRVYRAKSRQCLYKVWRAGESKLFYDGSWKFFYRRPEFSPDGRLLITPAGICNRKQQTNKGQLDERQLEGVECMTEQQNAAHIFVRHNLSKVAVTIPTGQAAVLGVRFNPIRFNLRSGQPSCAVFKLAYRWIFALIIETGVLIFDTEQETPIAKISNIHCLSITDASWSPDGRILVVSSTDSYCTYVYFEEGELGELFIFDQKANAVLKSTENTDASPQNDESSKQSLNLSAADGETLKNVHDQTTELLEITLEPKKNSEQDNENDKEKETNENEKEKEENENKKEKEDNENKKEKEDNENKIEKEENENENEEEENENEIEEEEDDDEDLEGESNVNDVRMDENDGDKQEDKEAEPQLTQIIDLTDDKDSMEADEGSDLKIVASPSYTPKITSLFPPKSTCTSSIQRSSSTTFYHENLELEAKIKRANTNKAKRRVTLIDIDKKTSLDEVTEESVPKKARYSSK